MELGKRGQELFDAIKAEIELDPAGEALLLEACRTAQIVERLEGALASKHQEWVRLAEDVEFDGDVAEVRIVINPLLSEVRQQRLALVSQLKYLKLGFANAKESKEGTKSAFDKLIDSLNQD